MVNSTTGLVAGKFDPPHLGHALLIDIARARCTQLIAIVLDEGGQTTTGEQRVAWLQEIHPGVDVRLMTSAPVFDRTSASTVAASVAVLAERVRELTADKAAIDLVFSSEPYGELLSASLGAEHNSIDRDRVLIPVTGTLVRRNPARALRLLEPVVRAFYVPRVCIAGAESTGKSTLAARLAERYATVWAPEYGRSYALGKSARDRLGSWESDEFAHIAFEQQRIEDDAARRADPVLICDTDVLATRIWHEFYLGTQPRWPHARSKIALYLLPFPDVPFVADAIREGEHRRYWMHERFTSELTRLGARFEVLQGSYDDRYEQAVTAIDALIAD
jgi:NadR type nicotinamide-nucleotide adenylyltransferase